MQKARLEVTGGDDRGKKTTLCGGVLVVGTAPECDIVLCDPAISKRQFEIQTSSDGFLLRDLGSTNGTFVQGLRVREVVLNEAVRIDIGRTRMKFSPLSERESHPLSQHHRFGRLWGKSPLMRRSFALLERAAATDMTVLIEGESGTGKDLAAHSIHDISQRADGPFVVVDCGAIPAGLIESELFGHEKGAFTGATESRLGAFDRAEGGTLFFDEIGELDLTLQPRLLRFLEDLQVRPIGGSSSHPVDLRIIAATNRHLADLVTAGGFRQDLFFRLAVIRIEMPPLRQRPEDIPVLALEFARQLRPEVDPLTWLDDHTVQIFSSYHWPGNARELRNAVERLILLPELHPEGVLPEHPAQVSLFSGRTISTHLPYHEAKEQQLAAFEKHYVQVLLEEEEGVVVRAAKRAGVPRQTFFRLIRKHGLRED